MEQENSSRYLAVYMLLEKILAKILKILARILKIMAKIFFKAIRLKHQNHLSWRSKTSSFCNFYITSIVFSYISIRTVPNKTGRLR